MKNSACIGYTNYTYSILLANPVLRLTDRSPGCGSLATGFDGEPAVYWAVSTAFWSSYDYDFNP
jgi:hypothetical protein